MDTNTTLRHVDDYPTHFDPKSYMGEIIQSIYYDVECGGKTSFRRFILEKLHRVFSSGNIKGERLLDIASGPAVQSVISASKWFSEITLSDFAEVNRNELQKWLNGDPEAVDCSPVFSFISSLEPQGPTKEELQARVKQAVVGVRVCDVRQSNPLIGADDVETFDCIIVSLCLCTASESTMKYKENLSNMLSLLRQGGHLIMVDVLNEDEYRNGAEMFASFRVQETFVCTMMEQLGLINIDFESICTEHIHDNLKGNYDCGGVFVTTATKC